MARFPGVRRLRGGTEPRAEEEIRFHLEARADELERLGLSRTEAEARARAEFGNLDAARADIAALDGIRDARRRRASWWADFGQDLRFATRIYVRSPTLTATLLLTFALGVGATTGIFTVVRAVVMAALPYRDAGRLVYVAERVASSGRSEASWPDLLDWRSMRSGLAGFEGFEPANRTVYTPEGGAEVVRAGRVTAGFFDLLGVRADRGRLFLAGEDPPGGTAVVVLSQDYWRRAFAADTAAIGRSMTVDGQPHTIVGVLPPGFQFAGVGDAQMWLPVSRSAQTRSERSNHWIHVVGRLAPGASIVQAREELAAVMSHLAERYPESNAGRGAIVEPLRDELVGPLRPVLRVLAGAVVLLLLLTCANIAGLLLARAQARGRELSVRLALGAGRWRLARQLLAESLAVALAGAVLGVPVAYGAVNALLAAIPNGLRAETPALTHVGIDPAMLCFTAVMAIAAGLAFGAAPAWIAARFAGPAAAGAPRATTAVAGSRLRGLLVTSEIALALVLVVGTALVARSLGRLLSRDPGFDPAHVLTFRVPLSGAGVRPRPAQQEFYEALMARLAALPGVTAVGATTLLPLSGGGTSTFRAEALPEPPAASRYEAVRRGIAGRYFQAMGIRLVAGRDFSARDDSSARRAIVVNESLARRLFGSPAAALEQRFRFYAFPDTAWSVVGVVQDVTTGRLDEAAPFTVYYTHLQSAEDRMSLTIRTAGDPSVLARDAIAQVRALDAHVPVYSVQTMDEAVADSPAVFARRYPLLLLASFAGEALLLALVGVYGVVAHSAMSRWRELGIRVALGATGGSILRLVLRDGVRLAAVGVACGVLLSLSLGHFLSAVLYDIQAFDVATYAAGAILLGVAALGASLVPARRAAMVDPAVALRSE